MKRLLFLPLCLLLCGCSRTDAGDLSPVTAGAIAQHGSTYLLTAELAIPSEETAVPSAKTVSGEAKSLAHAIDSTGAGLDAQLYWSHARVLFLDRSLLTAGISSGISELTHSSEVRPAVRLCAVRNAEAENILQCESVSGEPVGFALGDSISYAVRQSQTPDLPLFRVLDRVRTAGIDPILPAVSITNKQAVLSGCALFSGDVLSGWLDEQQTATLALLLADGDTAMVYDTENRYQLRNIRTEITAKTDKQPSIAIRVHADCACEADHQADRAAAVLQQQCVDVVQQLRQTDCDALGFGRAWERADAAGSRRASADAWRTLPVRVTVTLRAVQSAEGGSR